MKGGYTLASFNSDLAQLGGMIENFYQTPQHSGGKPKRKKEVVKTLRLTLKKSKLMFRTLKTI